MVSGEYVAVSNYDETGDNEILFESEPIPHIAYTESSGDDFAWGYSGAGPTNIARSILEHALSISNQDLDVNPADYQIEFRKQFVPTSNRSKEGWTIDYTDAIEFLKSKSP